VRYKRGLRLLTMHSIITSIMHMILLLPPSRFANLLALGDLLLVVRFSSLSLFKDPLINKKAHALVVWPWKYSLRPGV
jgi:hypothetical protein